MIWDKENSDYLEEGIPLIPPFCCIGLDYMFKSDSEIVRFLGRKSADGELIERYNEHPLYLYHDAGDVGFYSELVIDDVNKTINSQNMTPVGKSERAIWDALVAMRLKESGDDYSDRFIILKRKNDGKGLAVLKFLNPDIVPSYLENDEISLRVTAYPEMIRYYENEEEYESDIRRERGDRKTYLIREGTIFPLSFLWNHDEEKREGNDFSNDNVNFISGIVKDVLPGILNVDEDRDAHFLRCFIETEFGELEIIHTEDEVPAEYRDSIHPGAFVHGAFQLVGNPAVSIFEHGLVRNEECNLRRLRQVLVAGSGSDLSAVLDSEVSLQFDGEEEPRRNSKEELICFLDAFHHERPNERIADLVTITETGENSLYPVGKRGVAYQETGEDGYGFIVFIDTNKIGEISKVVFSFDSGYSFVTDPDMESLSDSTNAGFSPENETRVNGRHGDERSDLLFVLNGGAGYVSKRKLLNLLFEKKYMHRYLPREKYREFKKLMKPYENSKTREYMDHDRYEELRSEIKAAGMKLIETLDEKSLQNFRAGGTCVKDEDIDRILAERKK